MFVTKFNGQALLLFQSRSPKDKSMYFHQKTCTRMPILVILIITPKWDQAKCSSVEEWISGDKFIKWNTINNKRWTMGTLTNITESQWYFAK